MSPSPAVAVVLGASADGRSAIEPSLRALIEAGAVRDVRLSAPGPLQAGRHVLAEASVLRCTTAAVVSETELGSWFPPGVAVLGAYRVEPRVQWSDPVVEPSAPVTQFSGVVRAAVLDHEGFVAHWSQRHAPLARVHHPGIARYVQHVVTGTITPDSPALDGIAELAFASEEDLRNRFYDSEPGREIIAADVQRFLAPRTGWRLLAADRRLDPGS